jgi:hypothetical protein
MRTKVSPIVILAILVGIVVIRSFTLLPADHGLHTNPILQHLDPSPPQALMGQRRTFVFVHVGKTGGETIKWRLKLSCKLRASRRKKERCYEQFEHGESLLSNATIGYMHCDKLRPKPSIENATTFLISLRDPIDRIVSWFQYMHPQNCLPERPSAACNLKRENNSWGLDFYHECFPEVNKMFRSIQTPLVVGSINCSQMALETIQGNGPEGPSNHMFFNYYYLANKTVLLYPKKDVMVVRQEMLWDDLRRIEQLLGGDPMRSFETEGPIVTHGSEKFLYRAKLDPTLVPTLCCAIPKEIRTYIELLDQSKNLESRHKKYSIKNLLSKCQTESLPALSTRCGWHD